MDILREARLLALVGSCHSCDIRLSFIRPSDDHRIVLTISARFELYRPPQRPADPVSTTVGAG